MQTHLKNIQRVLRKNMPAPEIILWQKIRDHQLGVKFRRQFTVGNYILDFYAPRLKLAIEIDGESHFEDIASVEKDKQRDLYLKKKEITVIRFTNREIIENVFGCLEKIVEVIKNSSPT